MSVKVNCIALTDSVEGRDLPLMVQGQPVLVTKDQYEANTDILKMVKTEPEPKAKPKAKAKAKK